MVHIIVVKYARMTRGGAARKLAGLITRRSQVQILSSQPNEKTVSKDAVFFVFTDGLNESITSLVARQILSSQPNEKTTLFARFDNKCQKHRFDACFFISRPNENALCWRFVVTLLLRK